MSVIPLPNLTIGVPARVVIVNRRPATYRLYEMTVLRHTTATLLKNLGVQARDAQIILGHSRLAITLEIYTHEDRLAHCAQRRERSECPSG